MNEKLFTLEDMDEEYINGAKDIISFLRREGIICRREDNCGECNKVDKYLEKRKSTETTGGNDGN